MKSQSLRSGIRSGVSSHRGTVQDKFPDLVTVCTYVHINSSMPKWIAGQFSRPCTPLDHLRLFGPGLGIRLLSGLNSSPVNIVKFNLSYEIFIIIHHRRLATRLPYSQFRPLIAYQ